MSFCHFKSLYNSEISFFLKKISVLKSITDNTADNPVNKHIDQLHSFVFPIT